MLLLFSCASQKRIAPGHHIPPPPSGSEVFNSSKIQVESAYQRKIIVQYAVKSLGLPYKWGGQSPETGFDCSGLIVYTYQKAGVMLPRTAKKQFGNGQIVSKQNLRVADLVFFKTPKVRKVFHVGIYIGDGIFVHAPGKGRQVTYGYLSNPYFKKHYIGARSYL
ncbi:MAG: C40 family peptidase [Deltaproteobacteria bacterium]|nr:C40 family peptidase [Deltaproteobacteria bacterium]